ncbi:12297_t:CDS:2 [Rhizophagus irregularis]|nr:12297_t:CDS:2 [Rhizophagus irregularis]
MDDNNEEIDNCEIDKLASKSCELMMNFNDCSLNNVSNLIDVSTDSISSQSIIPNIVQVDDKAYSTKIALESIINLGESVVPYLPLITAATSVIKQTVEVYEYAQYNKKSCAVLVQRVQAAEVALNHYNQGSVKNFCKQSYYYSFERFVAILEEIKGFIQDVTHLSGYRKFISNDNIKVRFQQLITDFDIVVSDLQLIMFIANEEKRKKDIDILQKDINEMTRFLEKINGGVTTSDKKISNIFEYIITLKGKSPEKVFNPIINIIDSNELKEPVGGSQPVVSSRNKYKIHKKLYRGQDVANKLITEDKFDKSSETVPSISSRVHSELAMLSNLGKCDYIIKLHGLCEKDGSVLSVFEWAENGNLRELYKKFDIEWPRKLTIAINICRGITFLHGCRVLQANTTDIGNITHIVRWLAPEKMDSGNRYTVQCEIFSGKRENLNFPSSSYGVEKEYGNIIRAAWLFDPSLRPELSYLFNVLEYLRSPLISDRLPRGLNPKRSDMEVTPIELPPGDIEFDLDQMDFILPMMKLEDGISAHKIGDRKKAFECFEKHAEINNKVAKYWLGHYYWEGYVVDKNLGDLYFNGKLTISKDEEKGLSYLKLAAIKGQPKARAMLDKLRINYFV